MPRCESDRPMIGGVRPRWGRGRALLALAGALAVLGACEGQGLYDVPAEPGEPGPGPIQPGTGRGEVITIPGVGVLADLVVDPTSQQAFLSNRGQHRVEVLRLDGLTFGNSVPVGSEPWGLALSRGGDTLIVANSGGTNVSFVHTGDLQEHVARRFDVPRVTLYDFQQDPEGAITLEHHNYSDRPQYVAQDYRGRLLYSAISTQAMPVGTIRLAEWKPGWQSWDARLLFPCCLSSTNQAPSNRAIRGVGGDTLAFAIANVDSISLQYVHDGPFAGLTGDVIIYDHIPGSLPGSPNRTIQTPPLPIVDAIMDIHARGSDIIAYPFNNWNLPDAAAMADTTFVGVSADRRWVAFGERPADRAGRIIMWSAADSALSRVEDISDIVNNTSDFINGVELNANGTLGVARGGQATYFFGSDLRLQGLTAAAGGGGRGASFLPGSNDNRTYAFEPTNQRTVRILETTHYRPVGEITTREAITGPFRVGPPRPGVDACPDLDGAPTCVVATAYGVTAQRRLLVLDIERQDIVQ